MMRAMPGDVQVHCNPSCFNRRFRDDTDETNLHGKKKMTAKATKAGR